MAYRFSGTDPFLRASIGAFNGYRMRGDGSGASPQSAFALLKRTSTGGWQGIWTVDQGSSSVYVDGLEFDPSNHLSGWNGSSPGGYASAATITDTTNWMIVGYTWTGLAGTGQLTWWWKIGAAAWQSEVEADSQVGAGTTTLTAGSGFRHVIGNEPGLGDDARLDLVCVGAIESNLTSTQVQSLTMTDIASWDSVFTGSGAWLLGFDAITTRTDRTGNGGNELSRSAGITLVADPTGFSWGGGGASQTGAASLSASGAVTSAGLRSAFGGSSLSASGSTTTAALRTALGGSSLSGSGSASTSGLRGVLANASMSGAGDATAGALRSVFGGAGLSAQSDLLSAASRLLHGSAGLSGAGSLGVGGFRSVFGASSLSGTGTVLVNIGGTLVLAAADLSGSGSVAGAGLRSVFADTGLSASGSVISNGQRIVLAGTSLTGAGSVDGTGVAALVGDALLSGNGLIVIGGSSTLAGLVTLDATGSLAADALLIVPAVQPTTRTTRSGRPGLARSGSLGFANGVLARDRQTT